MAGDQWPVEAVGRLEEGKGGKEKRENERVEKREREEAVASDQ